MTNRSSWFGSLVLVGLLAGGCDAGGDKKGEAAVQVGADGKAIVAVPGTPGAVQVGDAKMGDDGSMQVGDAKINADGSMQVGDRAKIGADGTMQADGNTLAADGTAKVDGTTVHNAAKAHGVTHNADGSIKTAGGVEVGADGTVKVPGLGEVKAHTGTAGAAHKTCMAGNCKQTCTCKALLQG